MLEHTDIKSQESPEKKKHSLLEIKDYLDLKYEFRRNTLTMEIEVRNLDEDDFFILDEAFVNSIWIDMQVDGFKCSDATLLKILNSKLTIEFNPLKNYIKQLPEWDGKTDHIGLLADTVKIKSININNVSQQDLWRPYLEKWLVASVATSTGRGINHLCLILVGNQGTGKTSWLNRLCPENMKEFLICSHINPSLTDNNTSNFLAEKWFVNIDDQLETIFGKDFNSMKAIITAPFVTNRKTWHRFSKKRPRVCSFMGSVNSPKFLTDTENRRYLVFTADELNYTHKVNMDLVWSQALHLLSNGHKYWFNQEEMKQLNLVNELYRQITPEEEWLMKLYEACEPSNPHAKFVMPSEILMRLNLFSGMKLSIRKLSAAMETLKYGNPISKRINGGSRKVYAVIERSEFDEEQYQENLKSEFAENMVSD